jgi:hypothetical protein
MQASSNFSEIPKLIGTLIHNPHGDMAVVGSTLKMEGARSYETLVSYHITTQITIHKTTI